MWFSGLDADGVVSRNKDLPNFGRRQAPPSSFAIGRFPRRAQLAPFDKSHSSANLKPQSCLSIPSNAPYAEH